LTRYGTVKEAPLAILHIRESGRPGGRTITSLIARDTTEEITLYCYMLSRQILDNSNDSDELSVNELVV
jgi:hypothetical protein